MDETELTNLIIWLEDVIVDLRRARAQAVDERQREYLRGKLVATEDILKRIQGS